MISRKNLPVAALRAFEAAARHGTITSAAEELGVTHGAISRHVSHLEAVIGAPLFEGARNRPKLTAEGRVFGFALTAAFDQMEDALRLVARGSDNILDVACLSTFAMRWLIPRLHHFTAEYPHYDVRLATDDRQPSTRVDVRILVLSSDVETPENGRLLFREELGVIASPALVNAPLRDDGGDILTRPRLETRTRPHVWQEWSRFSGQDEKRVATTSRTFDHYHLTIEAALNGLGVAVVPRHLVADDLACGRLVAPYGFVLSDYRYVVKTERQGKRKAEHFANWLIAAIAGPDGPSR